MRIIYFLCAYFFINALNAQYVFPEKGYLFDDTTVPRIDIEIDQDSLDFILNEDNLESDHEFEADFYFTKNSIVDTVENVGFRLRGNTSRKKYKKSFKVSFNSFKAGKDFYGVEKLNLNGEANDPSLMRSKTCWDLFRLIGVPASRSNHVELYINNEYRGLYLNVEHIDEEFIQKRFDGNDGNLYKCLYPADLLFKGNNPNEYKEEFWGRRAYELKINEDIDDYSDIANFIDILNNTPEADFKCAIESVFDVENYLKVIAMDILIGNWDGPIVNKNNFYLYKDPCTNKFTYFPYDLDNTFGIDYFGVDWSESEIYHWSNYSGQDRPIYDMLIGHSEYRDKLSFYLDSFSEAFFNTEYLSDYFNTFRNLIQELREDDIYSELDNGWSYDDFIASFDISVGDHVSHGLLEYVERRKNSVLNQLESYELHPILEYISENWTENKIEIDLQIKNFDQGQIRLFTQENNDNWVSQQLFPDNDNKLNYEHQVNTAGVLNYYLVLQDFNDNQIRRWPACENYQSLMGYKKNHNLVINEIMSSNKNTIKDDHGEYEDWVEIYNNESFPILLSNYYLSDDPLRTDRWRMPHVSLLPHTYYTIWLDDDTRQGANHANFKLKKAGEFLGIFDNKKNNFAPVDTLTFPEFDSDITYGRSPNGTGNFDVLPFVSFNANNDIALGLKESEIKHSSVFPNPSTDIVQIDMEGHFTLKLYNNIGNQILEKNNIREIKFDNLKVPEGIYFLIIETENVLEWHKIVFAN